MPLSKTDMIISDTVTGAASILFAGLRVATHLSQPGHKRRSEQIGMLSLVFAAMLVIPQVVLSRVDDWKTEEWYKVPRGEDELPYQLTSEPQQNHYSSYLLQIITIWVLKGSYLATFWGMKNNLSKSFKMYLYLSSVYVFLSFVAGITIGLRWCYPIWRNWAPGYGPGTENCDIFKIPPLTGIFAMNISADLVVLGLSILVINSLRIRERLFLLAIVLIFTIGLLSIFAAVARYVYIYNIQTKGTIATDGQYVVFWTKMEVLFATTAYGLTTARSSMRLIAKSLKSVSGSFGSTFTLRKNIGSGANLDTEASAFSRAIRDDEFEKDFQKGRVVAVEGGSGTADSQVSLNTFNRREGDLVYMNNTVTVEYEQMDQGHGAGVRR